MTATKLDKNLDNELAAPRLEQIVNDAPKLHATFETGDVSSQGDLIIVRIASLPASATRRKNRQLAEGNTQGSRHILARGHVYDCAPGEVAVAILDATRCVVSQNYIGPVFTAPANPTEHDLTHPEHGHQGFPAGSVCAVVYQRNIDNEDKEARVLD